MRLVVNALPITGFSGRHVLRGHLGELGRACGREHEIVVLHHAENRYLRGDLGEGFRWVEVPGLGKGWASRTWWELTQLPGVLRELGADVLLSTSGALIPRVPIPQWVLAQNPWCFFPQFHLTTADRLKARLQRLGYRRAQRHATAMFYLSDYLAGEYRNDAGVSPRIGKTLYVGVSEELFDQAEKGLLTFDERRPEIVAVSVMARHKTIEEVVEAVAQARSIAPDIRLALVGPWPDPQYHREIEALVAARNLTGQVDITGEVDERTLHEHYRRARAFCLLSRCESFGIPAIEAQVLGTPSIVANVCAPPEIAGPGGVVVEAGDIDAVGAIFSSWVTDPDNWSRASALAVQNAGRFRWENVSRPLIDMMNQFEKPLANCG